LVGRQVCFLGLALLLVLLWSHVPVRFAYADPPYLGCGKLYAAHHPDALIWDDLNTHLQLFVRLDNEFPDGWALSCTTGNLHDFLGRDALRGVRIGAWVKPFAAFRPNVNPAYAWEPVLFRGGRKRDRTEPTVRDWHSEVITMQKGLPGAKPQGFAVWIAELLGVDWSQDEIVDLFPGTGGMTAVWNAMKQTAETFQLEIQA
jgi:hypothetical protein